jgi:hypothetical protein
VGALVDPPDARSSGPRRSLQLRRAVVWLELSYDDSRNREFLTKYGATATPTFFVINAQDETVVAMQPGAMSLAELRGFLERGASAVLAKEQTPADAALMRADAVMAQQPEEAAKAYLQALQLGATDWPRANSQLLRWCRHYRTASSGNNAPSPQLNTAPV